MTETSFSPADLARLLAKRNSSAASPCHTSRSRDYTSAPLVLPVESDEMDELYVDDEPDRESWLTYGDFAVIAAAYSQPWMEADLRDLGIDTTPSLRRSTMIDLDPTETLDQIHDFVGFHVTTRP